MEKKGKATDPVQNDSKFRGVNVNEADDCKVNPEMVKQDVKELNNNPRNDDM
ncbi:MAG: hypothetical protein NC411_10680 [Bacteroides sp.]|nr:hypothetical protein [Bacteroides sp.]